MKKLVVLFTLGSLFTLYAQDTAAVEYAFTISDEFNNSQQLIIGKDPFGSEGLDPQFGEIFVPQVPSGQFGARLVLPTDSTLTTLKDIRFGCYWGDGFLYQLDLSYETNSNQLYVDWEWNSSSPYFIIALIFLNHYTGNQIQYFDFVADSSFFVVPQNLDKLDVIAYYNGTLSWEEYQLFLPNGGDTLYTGQIYNITFWNNQLAPWLALDFSSDGENTWDTIATGVWTSKTNYLWTVPNLISDSCLVRVGNYPCVYDVSDTFFVIVEPVPVELLSFSSFVVDNDVTLNWTTATETNNSGFEILRKKSGDRSQESEWENVSFISGNGTTTEPQTYSFTNENLSAGKYQYRLKQIDFDGTFEYSKTVEVEINPPAKFSLEQNYPNPFNPSTNIQYAISSRQFVSLKIFNSLGEEVVTLVNEYQEAGIHSTLYIGNSTMPSGIYFYRLTAGDYNEIKKMLLLK